MRANADDQYDEGMKRAVVACCLAGMAILVGACSGDGSDDTTTTSGPGTSAPVTSLSGASTTSEVTTVVPTVAPTTTQDPSEPPEFPEYTIVSSEEGEDGNTVVILIDEGAFSLTDIDLANILVDAVERFPPILTAYVVDDADAAVAVLAAEPTPEQLELLERHYLVRLEDGFRMVFTGPFSEVPPDILGS